MRRTGWFAASRGGTELPRRKQGNRLDLPANPFGITTSNLVMHHIVAPFAVPLPVSSVFLTNSLGPIGTMSRNGLVTRFY